MVHQWSGGIYICVNPYNGDSRSVVDHPDSVALVKSIGLALMGVQLYSRHMNTGIGNAVLRALDAFTDLSDRPELESSTIFFDGYSWGGCPPAGPGVPATWRGGWSPDCPFPLPTRRMQCVKGESLRARVLEELATVPLPGRKVVRYHQDKAILLNTKLQQENRAHPVAICRFSARWHM